MGERSIKLSWDILAKIESAAFYDGHYLAMRFGSSFFKELLDKSGFYQSMSSTGNCYDNAIIESFFATLKKEHVFHERFETRDEARTSIFKYIEMFYKRKRLHSSL